MSFTYKQSILGGTFDHLHLGHKKLIDTAFEKSEYVAIGLALPILYRNKALSHLIENYSKRLKELKNYLKEKNYLNRAKIIPIKDIYGTTLKEKNIEAIFVTEETLPNVNLINSKRKKLGFPKLKIVLVQYIKSSNGEIITSEKIRKGEIDRDGFVYKSLFEKNESLVMPENLRPILQKPIGPVVKNTKELIRTLDKNVIIIAVGDIIATELKKISIDPAVSIIDFRTRRHLIHSSKSLRLFNPTVEMSLINNPGTINRETVNVIKKAIDDYLETNKPQVVVINGEEDLLALPSILLAPLNSLVLYGQFDIGIVVNRTTEELKNYIREIAEKFEKGHV